MGIRKRQGFLLAAVMWRGEFYSSIVLLVL